MASPIRAILWELWRVNRAEAAWKLAIGVVGGSAALALLAALAPADNPTKLKDLGAAVALALLFLPHLAGWVSSFGLNAGRPGFPYHHLFARPVRTAVIIGLPLAYAAVASAAIYLVSALLLRVISGYPFPLLSVAAWVALLSVTAATAVWSVRKPFAMGLAWPGAFLVWSLFPKRHFRSLPEGIEWHSTPSVWPALFDVPLTSYVLMALVALACFGVAYVRVASQRRGDTPDAVTATSSSGELWPWLIGLFRITCPASSATRAQIWFDLKTNGLPTLAIGLAIAMLIPLFFAVSVPIDAILSNELRPYLKCTPDRGCFHARGLGWMFALSAPMIVLLLGGNALGIRPRQGRSYVSPFEAAQACDTARLVGLKLVVRSVCVLAALLVIGVSFWTSLPLLGEEGFHQITNGDLSTFKGFVTGAMASLAWYEQLAFIVMALLGVVVWVTTVAVLRTMWVGYFRALNIAASILLAGCLMLVLLALAERYGFVSAFLAETIIEVVRWSAIAAVVLVIGYLFWSGFAEAVLTARYAVVAVAITAVLAAAWLIMLRRAGVDIAEMPVGNAASILTALLLPLIAIVLAPWSFHRVRHL